MTINGLFIMEKNLFELSRVRSMRALFTVMLVAASLYFTSSLFAYSVNINVPGTSNVWLAGMPSGSIAGFDDKAPGQSPVLVATLPITPGATLRFNATGWVNNDPSYGIGPGPDGSSSQFAHYYIHPNGDNGISSVTAPWNSLIGVFLGSTTPNSSPTPNSIDFSVLGLSFNSLSPALKQPFFIGDGLTGTGVGSIQNFIIPDGATRLYLGTMDSNSWYNNTGSFNATASTVPIPGAFWLLGSGLVGFRLLRRRLAK